MKAFLRLVFIISVIISSTCYPSYAKTNFSTIIESGISATSNTDTTLPDGLKYFVSNKGSDSNDGTSASSPKMSISSVESLISTLPNSVSITSLNLEKNSLFREEYNPVRVNGNVTSFGMPNNTTLAKMTGMDVINDWASTTISGNVYQHLLKHSIDLTGPAYNYIIVAEIDTAVEKNRPASSIKYLTLVASLDICKNSIGTYFTQDVTANPAVVYIHPTEPNPGKNKFRYEVTTRNFDINGYYVDGSSYNNLLLQASGNGYGMLSAGKNSSVKNSVFQGGGTHHTVIKSGQIDSCLFLPGPGGLKDRIAAVFYSAEGRGANNKITNSIFLGISNPVYTHTDGQVNHQSLLLDNVYAFADTADAYIGLSSNNTDSVEVNNCYVEGYPMGWWYGGGRKLTIKNSIFRKTNQAAILPISDPNIHGDVKIKDVLIVTNGNDNNQDLNNGWTAYGVRSPYGNLDVDISNTIIHGYSTWHTGNAAVTAFQVYGVLKSTHNIYICDVNEINSMLVYRANNSGGRGTSLNIVSDSNVYILARGSRFYWIAEPNYDKDLNLYSLPEWQALTGQDKHSVFIDIRNNPLGLNAIFTDPSNGNWTLTNSPQADSIRRLAGGITNPPLYYPKRPAMDYDSTPFRTPSGFSSFSGELKSESESILQWQTFYEAGLTLFNLESSLDGTHFINAGSLSPTNNNKNNKYQLVHTHIGTDSIYYRLKYSYADNSSAYSSIIKLRGNFSQELKITVYPNPFQEAVTVWHPRRSTGEIKVYDFSGKLIKVVSVAASSSRTPVSLVNLSHGTYFVQWSSATEKLSGTIVK